MSVPVSLSIADILAAATTCLSTRSTTSRLDAEIVLAHVLGVARSYFFAYPEKEISLSDYQLFADLIEKAAQGVPIAYLIGAREFWSLSFKVTPAVLIPRPETELLIEKMLDYVTQKNALIADLGTGSGAIAIALAHERAAWEIYATDASEDALCIARENAKNLVSDRIKCLQGDWCAALPAKLKNCFTAIVSNPPYLASDDVHLAELAYEPKIALVAERNGLAAFEKIIDEAKLFLIADGYLFLEHGATQGESVRALFQQAGYAAVQTVSDLAGLPRVTFAQKK